jgi:hypothetical protein
VQSLPLRIQIQKESVGAEKALMYKQEYIFSSVFGRRDPISNCGESCMFLELVIRLEEVPGC